MTQPHPYVAAELPVSPPSAEPARDTPQPRPPVRPPSQYELPDSDDIPMETPRHMWQMILLISSLQSWLARRYQETGEGGYTGGNMFVYFSPEQVRNHDFRGPDFFAVVGTDPHAERRSWVVWDEGKGPDVVIELMSESTSKFDKTVKKDIYQDRVRVPEYFWFDPFDADDFAGFSLCTGIYKPKERDDQGRLTSTRLGLQLGPWQGTYQNVETTWLRWYTPEGELLLTEAEAAHERAVTEAGRVAQAEQRAGDAEQRAARLASKLRALGLDPDAPDAID